MGGIIAGRAGLTDGAATVPARRHKGLAAIRLCTAQKVAGALSRANPELDGMHICFTGISLISLDFFAWRFFDQPKPSARGAAITA
jgi:hypothetical protein